MSRQTLAALFVTRNTKASGACGAGGDRTVPLVREPLCQPSEISSRSDETGILPIRIEERNGGGASRLLLRVCPRGIPQYAHQHYIVRDTSVVDKWHSR